MYPIIKHNEIFFFLINTQDLNCVSKNYLSVNLFYSISDIPTCKNSFQEGLVRGGGCGWSTKQQNRSIRMLCSHMYCIDSHTNTHTRSHSLARILARLLQIPGDCISFAGVREPLSICGRLPELPGELERLLFYIKIWDL